MTCYKPEPCLKLAGPVTKGLQAVKEGFYHNPGHIQGGYVKCMECLLEPAQSSENASCAFWSRQVGQGSSTGLRRGLTLGSTARALEAVVASQLLSPAGRAQQSPSGRRRLSAALHATNVHARQPDHSVLGRCPPCRSCP